MSEPPKKIACAICHKENIFFYYEDDRKPKLCKMHITINTTLDYDIPGHCFEVEVPDDFSAQTLMTLFKMFLRAMNPNPTEERR